MTIETGFSNPNTRSMNELNALGYTAFSAYHFLDKISSKKGLTPKRLGKAAVLPAVALFSNAVSDNFRKQIDNTFGKFYTQPIKLVTDIVSYILPAYIWAETAGFKKYVGIKEGKYVVVAFSFAFGVIKWAGTPDKN